MKVLLNLHFDRASHKLDRAASLPFVGAVPAAAKATLSALQIIAALAVGIFALLGAAFSSEARSLAAYSFTDLLLRGGGGLITSIIQAIPVAGTLFYVERYGFSAPSTPANFVRSQLEAMVDFKNKRVKASFGAETEQNEISTLPKNLQRKVPAIEHEITLIPRDKINEDKSPSLLNLAYRGLDEHQREGVIIRMLNQGALPDDLFFELIEEDQKIKKLVDDHLARRLDPYSFVLGFKTEWIYTGNCTFNTIFMHELQRIPKERLNTELLEILLNKSGLNRNPELFDWLLFDQKIPVTREMVNKYQNLGTVSAQLRKRLQDQEA